MEDLGAFLRTKVFWDLEEVFFDVGDQEKLFEI